MNPMNVLMGYDRAEPQYIHMDMGLIHGDLYRKNVIISENHRKIRGIIDWSDSAQGS